MLAVQSFGFSLIALIIKTPDRAEKIIKFLIVKIHQSFFLLLALKQA